MCHAALDGLISEIETQRPLVVRQYPEGKIVCQNRFAREVGRRTMHSMEAFPGCSPTLSHEPPHKWSRDNLYYY